LLLDSYSAPGTNEVKGPATMLGVTLHSIPPGLIDKVQPLDRTVFGVLKAQAKPLSALDSIQIFTGCSILTRTLVTYSSYHKSKYSIL
jgi:energy-converting hydrogenase Eha subunit F